MKAKRLSKKLHALIVVAAMIVAQLAAVLQATYYLLRSMLPK